MNNVFIRYLRVCFALLFVQSNLSAIEVKWPTPYDVFMNGAGIAEFVQPTASGKLESALYGCVRNGGHRFHEGLDIKPVKRDRKGEALDPIVAVMEGRVAFINTGPGRSNYGRYIVIEHDSSDLAVFTLYAHLARIDEKIKVGVRVQAGQELGIMGRSANHSIPRSRAHLHFEIGLRLSNDYQKWYNWKKIAGKNYSGNYNGWNLVGMDPLKFFEHCKNKKSISLREYVTELPTAYRLRISSRKIPDFIKRYPSLLERPIPEDGITGWEVEFTWYGLPKKWIPLDMFAPTLSKSGTVSLVSYNKSLIDENACRNSLTFKKGADVPQLGEIGRRHIELLFDFR